MNLTRLFCAVDDYCKITTEQGKNVPSKFCLPDRKKRRNREGEMSMSEIVTILVFFSQC